MNRFTVKSIFVLMADTVVSAMISAFTILLLRFLSSPVPGYSDIVLVWTLSALCFSPVAILISKIDRIIFAYASFRNVLNLFTFAIIKVAPMSGVQLLTHALPLGNIIVLTVADIALSFLGVIVFKFVVAYYGKEEEEEEQAVKRLNVLIYGTSPKSVAIVTRYEHSQNYNVLGFITRNVAFKDKIIMGYPVMFIPRELEKFHVKDGEAVLFATHDEWLAESDSLIPFLYEKGVCVLSVPSAQSNNYPGLGVKEIKHVLEDKFIPDGMTAFERILKRSIDFILSSILIVLFSPAMLVIYIVIKHNDGSPVLFRQERIGRFGRPFNILKFRTMRIDAEAGGPALYAGDDDPRLTKVGRFLRVHHLDEMPQLFNVFTGDMSFVGYRPERKVFIDRIVEKDPRYAYLYQIRPGVTSYATLKNGYTDTLDKMLVRLKYDLYYLNHRSMWFDLKVLFNTFTNIIFGKKF